MSMIASCVDGTGAYLRLKVAQELYKKTPDRLDADEAHRLDAIVARQMLIEERILASPEAAALAPGAAALSRAVGEIRSRYASDDEFLADMARSGLDAAGLSRSLARDLQVEAVLERVGANVAGVSDTDVELYYLMHRDSFRRPETRSLRHILVTINDALAGSDRASAQARVAAISKRLLKTPKCFGEQAQRYSECPTALSGGKLGTLIRGQLYPELDAVAFELAPGGISPVVESPLGFHLLQCVAVEASCELTLAEVHEKIRERIAKSRRDAAIKGWISQLLRQPA